MAEAAGEKWSEACQPVPWRFGLLGCRGCIVFTRFIFLVPNQLLPTQGLYVGGLPCASLV